MGKKEDDLYINILKEGRECLGDGIRIKYLRKFYSLHKAKAEHLICHAFTTYDGKKINLSNENEIIHLSLESYFHLLEYEQLQEARKSAKNAKLIALFAICVSIVASVVSIIYSYKDYSGDQEWQRKQLCEMQSIKAAVEGEKILRRK